MMTTMRGSPGDCDPDTARRTAASRIFDTARELFYRRGIRAVGIEEIVCEAGVTKPSLYRAFKSKDALVTACIEDAARAGHEAVTAAIADAGDDPRQRLLAVIGHFATKVARPDYRGCLLSNVAVELPEPGHPGRTVVEACKTSLRGTLAELARSLPIVAPDALADGLMLVIEGSIASHHVFGSQGPAQALYATCTALIDAQLQSGKVEQGPANHALLVPAHG